MSEINDIKSLDELKAAHKYLVRINDLNEKLELARQTLHWIGRKSIFIGFRIVTRDLANSTLDKIGYPKESK